MDREAVVIKTVNREAAYRETVTEGSDAEPDPAFHIDADLDPTIILMRIRDSFLNTDSDPHQSDSKLQHWSTDLNGSIVSLLNSRMNLHRSGFSH